MLYTCKTPSGTPCTYNYAQYLQKYFNAVEALKDNPYDYNTRKWEQDLFDHLCKLRAKGELAPVT